MSHAPVLDAFRVIAVAPMYPGNVGAMARVTANFDVRDVHVVSPQCDLHAPEALMYARAKSRSYLDRFQVTGTLEAALEGCAVAVGFARRDGLPSLSTVNLGDVAALARFGRVALVFGREDSGLSNQELLLCQHVCSIEVADVNPSMNLSHALAVVLARVYESVSGAAARGPIEPRAETCPDLPDARRRPGLPLLPEQSEPLAPLEEFHNLLRILRLAMVEGGLVNQGNPDRMLAEITRVLQRAGLSQRDIQVLHGLLSALRRAMGTIAIRPKR